MLKHIISRQLNHPSGLLGRYLLPIIWNKRNRPLNDVALSKLSPQPEDRILEVGFGGGYLIGKLSEQVIRGHLSGVDASKDILEESWGRTKSGVDLQPVTPKTTLFRVVSLEFLPEKLHVRAGQRVLRSPFPQ